jgi:hypothetical protein
MGARIGLVVAPALLAAANAAHGGFANDYAVFGGHSLTFEGFAKVSGGPAGSNGDVIHQGGIGYFDSLRGGGALNPAPPTAWNARQNVGGDVVFNGGVRFNDLSTVNGSVHSGGAATVASVGGNVVAGGPVSVQIYNDVGGNIVSGGNVSLLTGVNVTGNVGANGDVAVGQSAHVAGTVTLTGNLTQGAFSSVGGTVKGSVSPAPQAFAPVALPPATVFTSGGANVTLNTFDNVTLQPGKYGALTLGGATDLHLSGGNYYFDSISSTGTFLDLYLDLTHGPINVFVTGDVEFKRVTPHVNGGDYKVADSSLAGDVYLESHGNVTMSGEFFGSIYSPDGDVTTGTIGAVTGSIIAGRDAVIGSATNVADGTTTYVASAYLAAAVPEPSGMMIGVIGLLGARRRNRAVARRGSVR